LSSAMAARLDSPEAARTELHRLYENPPVNLPLFLGGVATWSSYFGDQELALKIHRELFALRQYALAPVWLPSLKEMRRLPGFKDLVQGIGLVEYWRGTGHWGDFCRPVGHTDFECE
jgi:hypothetical protein